jgi:hypothetical protein
MIPWRRAVVGLAVAGSLAAWPVHPTAHPAGQLPDRITYQEFWSLTETLSEPGGSFRSDNLLSNEIQLQSIIPDLLNNTSPGGVYLGVGPEQNFTYIAALKPRLVFIIDIRRGNLQLQLMYKALFELSTDRAEFVSRLFTKRRPEGLGRQSTAAELMNAYWDIRTGDDAVYKSNLQAILDQLTKKDELPLSADDIDGIEYVYHSFYWFGPAITYNSSSTGQAGGRTTYADLMMLTDRAGQSRGYLATEENFELLRDLEVRNLIVPVVGNFAGPKAIRSVGKYIRDRGATVAAFYLSNVEQYLNMDGSWGSFCANVATLPLDEHSTFIRSARGQLLGNMLAETRGCASVARSPVRGGTLR